MNKLKVCIAGHGLVGKRRHSFIDRHPQMKVTAVSDKRYSKEYERIDDLSCYRDYRELLDKEEFDALFVCLPNDVAADATKGGLLKNAHVFCEKPPGKNLAEIISVQETEKKSNNLKLKYGFNHRYHDSVLEALKLVNSGDFGKIINMRGVYGKSVLTPKIPGIDDIDHHLYWRAHRNKAGGGILLDQGIHMVDLMRCFAGEFDQIKSFIDNNFWKRDVEDNAYVIMKNNDGVVAMMHSSATQWRHKFTLEITLENACLVLSGILSSTKSYGQEMLTIVYRDDNSGGDPREITTSYIHDNSWENEINDFAACIIEDKPITVGTSYDAKKTMELVYKIYTSDPDWSARYNISIS